MKIAEIFFLFTPTSKVFSVPKVVIASINRKTAKSDQYEVRKVRCTISDIISAHLEKMAGLDGRDLELDSLLVDLEHRVTRWVSSTLIIY